MDGRDLQSTVQQDPSLRRKTDLLCSILGVGEQTAIVLLAYLPQLGDLNRKQIAALVVLGCRTPPPSTASGGGTAPATPTSSAAPGWRRSGW